MSDSAETPSHRLTSRGAATRERILSAAVELMHVQGVAATSLDDVMAASGTGKSQMYHYFVNKDALVAEVVDTQIRRVLDAQLSMLRDAQSMEDFTRWRDAEVMDVRRHRGGHGCPIGSLAVELCEHSEAARTAIMSAFDSWESLLANALAQMQRTGHLAAEADPAALASGIMAALQGGLMRAQTYRDPDKLAHALDLALDRLRSLTVEGQARRR